MFRELRPDSAPDGVSAYTIGKPRRHEMPIRIASQRALVFGDAVVGTSDGLRVWEQTDGKRRERWYAERFLPDARAAGPARHRARPRDARPVRDPRRPAGASQRVRAAALVPPRLTSSPNRMPTIYGSGSAVRDRRRPDLQRARDASALPRAVRPRRRRLPDRRRQLPRRHRRARRRPGTRPALAPRAPSPSQGRAGRRLPGRVRVGARARLRADRPDGLRPLTPSGSARGDAGGGRPRRRPRAGVTLRGRWRNERLVARASHHLAGRVHDGDARARAALP